MPLPAPSLRVALALLAAGAAGLVAVLARFWGTNPEYADRFLVLVAAGWVARQRRADLAALPPRPLRAGLLLVLLGAAAYPAGWFLQAQVAAKPVVLWWLALAWLAAAAGTALAVGGAAHLRRLAFPLLFVLFALPVPNRILLPLQGFLQATTTTAAEAVLTALGVPVERQGFVLRLPGGDLGVAEACSGVRSVTALTALAAFVAHLKGFGPARGALLLLLAVPVIAAVNALRVVLSGLIQEWIDPRFIVGAWHEGLGIGMVFLGLGLVVALAGLLDRGAAAGGEVSAAPPPPHADWARASRGHAFLALSFVLSAVGSLVAQVVGMGAERELAASAPLDRLPVAVGRWDGEDRPIPEYVAEMMTYDSAVHRDYTDRTLGYRVNVWAIYWSSQNMVKGYHHPDICWPNHGFRERAAGRTVEPIPVAGGGVLPVTVREFAQGARQQYLVLYWTQEGRRVWTQRDEETARLIGDSHWWLTDRLFGKPSPESDGRLVVLLGTPLSGSGEVVRKETLEFTRQLAADLYDLCPWARPRPGDGP